MQSDKKIAQRFLPAFFCLLASLLAACGSTNTGPTTNSNTEKASDDKQVYVSPFTGRADLKTFDPAKAGDINSINAVSMIFTGLLSLDDKQQIQKQLADSYSVAKDGVTWTFKLKPGLKFSDGSDLTSSDVAYSIDRALQPATKSGVAPTYLGLIKDSDKLNNGKIKTILNDSLLTPDKQTIVIITSQKAAYFLEALTYNTSFVIEKKLIDKYGTQFADHLNEAMGGAGPWKVAEFTHGKQIVFVPNPNYYGAKPQLKKVIMPFYKDDNTAYQAYQNGQIHTAPVPADQVPGARQLPSKQYHQVPQLASSFVTMNYLTKPFDNLKIRQAFALAINKQAIAHDIDKDTNIATNHVVPQGMPGYNPDLTGPQGVKSPAGDAALAKKLFDEGLKEEGLTQSSLPPITFTVATEGSTANQNRFAAMQQMWKSALGVNVKVADTEFGTLLDEADNAANNPKGIQMWYADWYADYPDPQDWLTLLFDKGAGKNGENYGQNTASYAAEQQANQQLMVQADANGDANERMQQYNKAEQQLVNDVAWIPIEQYGASAVYKPCVVGVVDNVQDLTPADDWGKIYISTDPTCAKAA